MVRPGAFVDDTHHSMVLSHQWPTRHPLAQLLGHGNPPWSCLATAPGRDDMLFQVMGWNWNPYRGHPSLNPMKATPLFTVGAWFDGVPCHAVERFTAPLAGEYSVSGRWFHKSDDDDFADGSDIRISLNGRILASGVVSDASWTWENEALTLRKGDILEFAVGPNIGPGGDYARRELRITGPAYN